VIFYFQEDIAAIFKKADKENSGTLTMKEFHEVMSDICDRYPQVELYLKSKGMHGITDLLKQAQAENGSNKSVELDIEELKSALCQVDSQVKLRPATGQVCSVFTYLKVLYIFGHKCHTHTLCLLSHPLSGGFIRSLLNKGLTLQNALIVCKYARRILKVPLGLEEKVVIASVPSGWFLVS